MFVAVVFGELTNSVAMQFIGYKFALFCGLCCYFGLIADLWFVWFCVGNSCLLVTPDYLGWLCCLILVVV